VSIAEIAWREGATERGIRTLIARRAPEAAAEFVAAQVNRFNEALLVSFDAMSGTNRAAVDRVIKIVRELDLDQGLPGKDGTERRRKLLESLDSRAKTVEGASSLPDGDWGAGWVDEDAPPSSAAAPAGAASAARGAEPKGDASRWNVSIREPDWRGCPPCGLGPERGAAGAKGGTNQRRKPLKTLDSGSRMAHRPSACGTPASSSGLPE
jgi:hypothetical protein